MHKTTKVFEEVVLSDTSTKPRNYRDSKIAWYSIKNGFFLFGGVGSESYGMATTGSPETYFFSFTDMKWYPKQIFPFLDLLQKSLIDISMDVTNRYMLLMSVKAYSNLYLFTFDTVDELWDIYTQYDISSIKLAEASNIKLKDDYVYVVGAGTVIPQT